MADHPVTAEHDVTGKREHKGIGATFTQKIHGVPVWGIALGGGLVLAIAYKYYASTHSNATPAASDSSADTPSGASDLTSADSGLPWSGGAPDGDAQYQNDIDTSQNSEIASNTAGIDALTQQESADQAANQSALLTLASNAAAAAAKWTNTFAALAVPAAAVPAPSPAVVSPGVGNPVSTVAYTPPSVVSPKASPTVIKAETKVANKTDQKGNGINSHGIQ